jgi:hypothetical protein
MTKKTEAATSATKRASRIAPIQDKLIPMLKKSAMSVKAAAAKLNCTEREIRLAIDRARVRGENIKRLEKGVFGYGAVR